MPQRDRLAGPKTIVRKTTTALPSQGGEYPERQSCYMTSHPSTQKNQGIKSTASPTFFVSSSNSTTAVSSGSLAKSPTPKSPHTARSGSRVRLTTMVLEMMPVSVGASDGNGRKAARKLAREGGREGGRPWERL